MMILNSFLILVSLIIPVASVSAQKPKLWTIDDCVKYAQEHNTDIKLAELNAETRQVALSNAKWAYSPEISASNSYTFSAGRVLDPTTYQFVENQYVSGNNTSVGASVALFNGMRNMHTLKRSQFDLKSALLGIEKARNDIRLNVTAYYLEILCGEENIRNAEQVVQTLRIQEDKTAKLVDAKKVTTADLLQIRSELAKAENNLLSARNSYDIARLNICQLLEIEDYTAFNTVAPTESLMPDAATSFESNAVVEAAQSLPELEAARLGIKIADRDLSIARAAYYPSLSLSAGYGTSYSDARLKAFQNPDGTYRYEAYSFASQYKDNASGFISLGLNIPIFGRMGVRNNVRISKIAIRQSEYNLHNAEKQVNREVQQALIDVRTAWEKYQSSQKYVSSASEAARQVERKYSLGTATVVDYNTALNALVQAQTQLLQAKYEYIFKTEIIKFYMAQMSEL